MSEPVLCYVKGNFAYFTTQPLADQWGDDWNDRPFEHNAGLPHEYAEYDKKQGHAPWQIVKVAFDGDFELPCEGMLNSPYSAQDINQGAVYWLRSSRYFNGPSVFIRAGVTIDQFRELIRKGGGKTYEETKEAK